MNKPNTTRIALAGVAALAVLCLACLAVAFWYGNTPEAQALAAARAARAASATPTELPATPTPQPSPTPSPTPFYAGDGRVYPSPEPDLYAVVVRARREMTDLQFADYRASLPGRRLRVEGQVVEVYGDGRVLLDVAGDGLAFTFSVEGLPREAALELARGDTVAVEATIRETAIVLGIMGVTCDDPVLWRR